MTGAPERTEAPTGPPADASVTGPYSPYGLGRVQPERLRSILLPVPTHGTIP